MSYDMNLGFHPTADSIEAHLNATISGHNKFRTRATQKWFHGAVEDHLLVCEGWAGILRNEF